MYSIAKRKKSSSHQYVLSSRQCVLWVVLCVTATACSSQVQRRVNPYADSKVKEVAHPNGLALRLPEELNVARNADGFSIAPPSSRGMSEMTVSLKVSEQPPAGDWPRQRQIETRRVRYRIDRTEGGGSGGDSYQMTAWEEVSGKYIFYRQGDHAEFGEPTFDLFWMIVENTRTQSPE
jgi:hypothetical protein